MLVRFVRMTFQEDKIEEFLKVFNENKEKIRHFPGCNSLEVLRDIDQPNVFMTHSHWDSEESLNNYRDSELFKTVWGKTKVFFADKPIAFSMESFVVV
ncbi:MAG: putative quinol monooxygenase [Spirosomataceae bacterium]